MAFPGSKQRLRQRFLEQSDGQVERSLDQSDFEKAALAITRVNQVEIARLQDVGSPASGTGGQAGSPSGARSKDDVAWSHTWTGLRNAARACVDIIDPYWADRSATQGYSDPRGPVNETAEAVRSLPAGLRPSPGNAGDQQQDVENWARSAEELIAFEVIAYVSQTTVQLKTLAYYLAVAPYCC